MKTSPLMRRRVGLPALAAGSTLLLFTACASAPVSVEQMAVAEASVQSASSANTSADAPRELQVATSKLAAAREAVLRKDYERARQLAEQAEVDARVAELHAQTVRSQRAAAETQDAARVLSEEATRKSAL
jgi:Domain of unknown function (DUF4398)